MVLTYDLLKDIHTWRCLWQNFASFSNNRSHVICMFFQTHYFVKFYQNISDTLGCWPWMTLFLPHFDIICNPLLNRKMATWNLFVTLMVHTHDYTFVIILQYNYACVAWCPLQFREKITSQPLRWYCKAVYLLVLPVITVSFGNTY